MKKSIISTLSVTCATMILSAGVAHAEGLYTSGHGDIGINYEDGEWDLHWHLSPSAVLEGSLIGNAPEGEEFEPGDITAFVADEPILRPAGAQWDPTGVAEGESLWTLPQNNITGRPFLGIAAEELETGIFVDDEVSFALAGVAGPGGEFSLWEAGAFGEPTFRMSSAGSTANSLTLLAGNHAHFNYGFTAPGLYEVTFRASGDLVTGGSTSAEGTYSFLVAPEPGSIALLGLGAIGLIRRSKRD